MGLRDTFKMDTNAEQNGIEETMGYNDDGSPIIFMLARAGGGNAAFNKRLSELAAPHTAAIASGRMPDKLALAINQQVFAETVMKGWKGVQAHEFLPTPAGDDPVKSTKAVPFSIEKARELFQLLPELYDDAAARARNSMKYTEAARETNAKN